MTEFIGASARLLRTPAAQALLLKEFHASQTMKGKRQCHVPAKATRRAQVELPASPPPKRPEKKARELHTSTPAKTARSKHAAITTAPKSKYSTGARIKIDRSGTVNPEHVKTAQSGLTAIFNSLTARTGQGCDAL